MKIFTVDFEPLWPVGCCLIIAAKDIDEANEIASQTIAHTDEFTVREVQLDKSKVIVYMDGDY